MKEATLLFAEKGFEATSVREIAAAAKSNVALINYHFGNKEGLLMEIISDRLKKMNTQIRQIADDGNLDAWQKVEAIIHHYVDSMLENQAFHRVLMMEVLVNNRDAIHGEAIGTFRQNMAAFSGIIENGILNKTFKKVDPELCFASIIGTIHHLMNSSRLRSGIFGNATGKDPINDSSFKERLLLHIKSFMQDHLIVK